MFVKFRRTPMRLAASLVETRRVDGAPRPEHIASLGSISVDPMTVAGRVAYWHELHKRLDKLGNRVGDEKFMILGAIHAQIPMVTLEEIPALQRGNFKKDDEFWSSTRDMEQERTAGLKELAAKVLREAGEAEGRAKTAGEQADVAKEKLGKLDKGEAVTGGLGEPMTREQMIEIMKANGHTDASIRHCENVATLSEAGLFEQYLEKYHRGERRLEHKVARKMVRDLDKA